MVNFYDHFLNCDKSRKATLQDVVGMLYDLSLTIHMIFLNDKYCSTCFLAHINYIRKLIGPDHIGIGADYEGVDE